MLHGEGDWIDISLQECAAGMLELYGPATAYGGSDQLRMGNQVRAAWAIYPCVDGYAGDLHPRAPGAEPLRAIGIPSDEALPRPAPPCRERR